MSWGGPQAIWHLLQEVRVEPTPRIAQPPVIRRPSTPTVQQAEMRADQPPAIIGLIAYDELEPAYLSKVVRVLRSPPTVYHAPGRSIGS